MTAELGLPAALAWVATVLLPCCSAWVSALRKLCSIWASLLPVLLVLLVLLVPEPAGFSREESSEGWLLIAEMDMDLRPFESGWEWRAEAAAFCQSGGGPLPGAAMVGRPSGAQCHAWRGKRLIAQLRVWPRRPKTAR